MKKVIAILLIVAAALTFCACGQKENTGNQKNGEHAPLSIMSTNVSFMEFEKLLAAQYPDVKLDWISYNGWNQTGMIREMFETNHVPDIACTTTFLAKELQKNNLMDLSPYGFVNNYTDGMLNACNVDGAIYLLPINYSAIGFYYNKTVLEAHGWPVPQTFEELVALAPEIEAAGLIPCTAQMDLDGFAFCDFFGLGNTMYFNTLEGANWKMEFLAGTADATGNLEPVVEYYQEWVDAGLIRPEEIQRKDTYSDFLSGKSAFLFNLGMNTLEMDIEGVGHMEYGILPWLPKEGGTPMFISNVTRYFGLNKSLLEPGNEQKLQDALHFMEFLSTDAGMSALNSAKAISPLRTVTLEDDSIYSSVKDYLQAGNTVPLVYSGWDDIIVPMAAELYKLIRGEQDGAAVLKAWDGIRNEWLANGAEIYADVPKELSRETVGKLVGKACLSATGADCILLSFGDCHGYSSKTGLMMENGQGIQLGLYEGPLNNDRVRALTPNEIFYAAERTGAEIRALADAGFIVDGDPTPFPVALITRDGAALDDSTVYRVFLPDSALTEAEKAAAGDPIQAVDLSAMIADYVKSLGGTLTEEAIGT